MTAYKLLTHDYRSPLQGGEPIWDGAALPVDLHRVTVDESDAECAAGWNYVTDLAAGFRIAGLWPDGRPSCGLIVEPQGRTVVRKEKMRAEGMRLLRLATHGEIYAGIQALSAPFGPQAERMALSQMAWREALARPERDEAQVVSALNRALNVRGLSAWKIQRTAGAARAAWNARAAGAAWDAWAARDARAAWTARAAWDAWDARAARAAWDARDARAARDAWDAWDAWAARDAWDAWAAWAAWDALTVEYAALQGWVKRDPGLLTVGLREAYRYGLEIAVPVGTDTLGWAMAKERPCGP